MKVRLRFVLTLLGGFAFSAGLWFVDPWLALSGAGLCLFTIGGFS